LLKPELSAAGLPEAVAVEPMNQKLWLDSRMHLNSNHSYSNWVIVQLSVLLNLPKTIQSTF